EQQRGRCILFNTILSSVPSGTTSGRPPTCGAPTAGLSTTAGPTCQWFSPGQLTCDVGRKEDSHRPEELDLPTTTPGLASSGLGLVMRSSHRGARPSKRLQDPWSGGEGRAHLLPGPLCPFRTDGRHFALRLTRSCFLLDRL
ncbi:mCG145897, partial [Mus musculus]